MKQWLLYPLLASAVTALLCVFTSISLGWLALIVFLGWPILGTFITVDDDLPGGWANPDGVATPAWETLEFWGQLLGGVAVVSTAFAIQGNFSAQSSPWLLLLTLLSAALSTYLFYRSARNVRNRGARHGS